MSEDIIVRIDEALGCQYCGKALRKDGPSPDFCGEPCQGAWRARFARQPARPRPEDRAALLHDRPATTVEIAGVTVPLVITQEASADSVAVARQGWLTQWFRRLR